MTSRSFVGFLTATLLLAALAGCGLGKRQAPSITSLTVTDQVDPHTKSPLAPRTEFPPTAAEFFASVRVAHAVKGTRVKAEWYYEGKLVDESDVVFPEAGDRYVAFNLISASKKPFPSGSYKVRVFLDDTAGPESLFSVQTQS